MLGIIVALLIVAIIAALAFAFVPRIINAARQGDFWGLIITLIILLIIVWAVMWTGLVSRLGFVG